MTNLLVRLNTYKSFSKAPAEEKEYGAGIYVDFGDESEKYKEGTFKKVIDAVLEQALVSEEQVYRDIAQDVQNYMKQQSPDIPFDIMVYDPKNNDFKRNVENEASMVMRLEDSVADYIAGREIETGEEVNKVDYLDIVTRLNPKVGGR